MQATDAYRLDWLNDQVVDVIHLVDGRIIDVKGNDVRSAIDKAARKLTLRHELQIVSLDIGATCSCCHWASETERMMMIDESDESMYAHFRAQFLNHLHDVIDKHPLDRLTVPKETYDDK